MRLRAGGLSLEVWKAIWTGISQRPRAIPKREGRDRVLPNGVPNEDTLLTLVQSLAIY